MQHSSDRAISSREISHVTQLMAEVGHKTANNWGYGKTVFNLFTIRLNLFDNDIIPRTEQAL